MTTELSAILHIYIYIYIYNISSFNQIYQTEVSCGNCDALIVINETYLVFGMCLVIKPPHSSMGDLSLYLTYLDHCVVYRNWEPFETRYPILERTLSDLKLHWEYIS